MGINSMGQVCATPNIQLDELNLYDMWMLLWCKELLIVLFTLLARALPYYFMTSPLHSGSIVIAQSSIATKGILNITYRFKAASLYRVDGPATAPKKTRALALGATLGTMLGVLVAVSLGYRTKHKAIVNPEHGA